MARIATLLVVIVFFISRIEESRSQDDDMNSDIENTEMCCKQLIELDGQKFMEEKKEKFFNCTGPNHILNEKSNGFSEKEMEESKDSYIQGYSSHSMSGPSAQEYWRYPRRESQWMYNGYNAGPQMQMFNENVRQQNRRWRRQRYQERGMVNNNGLRIQTSSNRYGKTVRIDGLPNGSEMIINGRKISGNQEEDSRNGQNENFYGNYGSQIVNMNDLQIKITSNRFGKKVIINGLKSEDKLIINGIRISVNQEEEEENKQKAINYMLEGNCSEAANEVKKMKRNKEKNIED